MNVWDCNLVPDPECKKKKIDSQTKWTKLKL